MPTHELKSCGGGIELSLHTGSQIEVRVLKGAEVLRLSCPLVVRRPNGNQEIVGRDLIFAASERDATRIIDPGEGCLVGAAAVNVGTAAQLGHAWVSISLARVTAAGFIRDAFLSSGLVSDTAGIGWPGGPLISHEGCQPFRLQVDATPGAVNTEISQSFDDNGRVRLRSVRARLDADGTASTRLPKFTIQGEGTTVFQIQPSQGQGANSFVGYNLGLGVGSEIIGATTAVEDLILLPLPDVWLGRAAQLLTSTANLESGDQWEEVILELDVVPA